MLKKYQLYIHSGAGDLTAGLLSAGLSLWLSVSGEWPATVPRSESVVQIEQESPVTANTLLGGGVKGNPVPSDSLRLWQQQLAALCVCYSAGRVFS